MGKNAKQQDSIVDSQVDDFDIDAWIDGASTETQTVRIYRNLGKLGEYQRLEAEFMQLQAELGGTTDGDSNPDASLGQATPVSRLQELAPRMKDVYETLQADALWVTVRGLADDEQDTVRKKVAKYKMPENEKGKALSFAIIAECATFRTDDGHEFTMPAAKLRALRKAIGGKQFDKITNAANEVNFGDTANEVMPDFSLAASVYLETKDS